MDFQKVPDFHFSSYTPLICIHDKQTLQNTVQTLLFQIEDIFQAFGHEEQIYIQYNQPLFLLQTTSTSSDMPSQKSTCIFNFQVATDTYNLLSSGQNFVVFIQLYFTSENFPECCSFSFIELINLIKILNYFFNLFSFDKRNYYNFERILIGLYQITQVKIDVKFDAKLKYINLFQMTETSSHSERLLQQGRQDSFYIKVEEDDDIQPHQLSGDESSQKSVLSSDIAAGGKANFMLTVTTIMKTVIGAGIIGLPLTISKLGYLFGLFVYLLVVAINQFTSVMLLKSKNLSRHSNYSSIMCHIFNSRAAQAICSATILLNNLGICIVELTIFKEALHEIFKQVWPQIIDEFYVQQWFLILALAALQIPFTIVQKIQKLKFMAFLGVAGIVVFIVCLIITFFDEMFQRDWVLDEPMQPFPKDWLKVAAVTPNIMLALAYQMNFFPIYKGLKNSNDTKMSRASMVGLGVVAFFYILVGNIGSALHGSNTKGNFLLNLKIDQLNDVLFWGMNGGFLISVFFSFSVMFFGARNNFIALMQMITSRNKPERVVKQNFRDSIQQISSYIQNGTREQKKHKAKILFYLYTAILLAAAIGIAIGVQDIEQVFNLVGAIASNAIGYIFPCLFYYLLIKYKNKKKTITFHIARALAFFFIPFGLLAIAAQYI